MKGVLGQQEEKGITRPNASIKNYFYFLRDICMPLINERQIEILGNY